jgi:hypothetical protein
MRDGDPSPPSSISDSSGNRAAAYRDAMNSEIAVLRGAVSALRRANASARTAAIGEVAAEMNRLRSSVRITVGLAAFFAGVATTLACIALYLFARCL